MADVVMVTYFCANCSKHVLCPSGPLPEGWVQPTKPIEHGFDGPVPAYTVLGVCSPRCLSDMEEIAKRKAGGDKRG